MARHLVKDHQLIKAFIYLVCFMASNLPFGFENYRVWEKKATRDSRQIFAREIKQLQIKIILVFSIIKVSLGRLFSIFFIVAMIMLFQRASPCRVLKKNKSPHQV